MRQKGGLPGPPPRNPRPRIPRRPGALCKALMPGSSSGPKCFQALNPRACYRVPCCETLKRGTPVAPRRVQGGLSGSPRIRAGTNKGQRSHARHPPLGQPQLNVPRKKSHPRGKPLQPRFPKEHHRRRAADDSLCGTRPQSKHRLQPGNGEGGRGGGWVLAATSAPPAGSACI